ncbi:MAG: GIY-YIG nuclease family protein [Armatimonadetes bacterium]|nr:GIY-YIG nuclease family protein [Armatimonadota bacterium]
MTGATPDPPPPGPSDDPSLHPRDVFAGILTSVLASTPDRTLAEQLSALPACPGCYLFYNKKGELLYVGKAISLRNRVRSYFHKDQHRAPKIRRLVKQIDRVEWREVPTELHALTLECRLIKQHQPRFNALLKGDKRLPRLRVTVEEPFPRVFLDGAEPNGVSRYFGPFTRHDSAEDLLDVLYRVFKLRSCDLAFTGKEGMRPCLYYDLDQCMAPCNASFCSAEEYREAVKTALEFLEGMEESLVERLGGQMEEAAEALLFEKAARLRDLRNAVLRWMERQHFLAGWEEPGSPTFHLFLVRSARLSGHCTINREEQGTTAWRDSIHCALQNAYAVAPDSGSLLGPVAIEELNIMEGWLQRKGAKKAFVTPPQGPEDAAALEKMTALVGEWLRTGGGAIYEETSVENVSHDEEETPAQTA